MLTEAPNKKSEELTYTTEGSVSVTSLLNSTDFKHTELCRTRKGESSGEGGGGEGGRWYVE